MKYLKKLISLAMAATCLSTTVTSSVGASFKPLITNEAQTNITESVLPQASQHYKILRDEEFLKQYTEQIQLGNITEEINVTLETTKAFPFTPENLESIRACIKDAIKKIYRKFNVYPKLTDIHILIDDTKLSKVVTAAYNFNKNLVKLKCSYLNKEHKDVLCLRLAHELTHKYLCEQFGPNIPYWFSEGIATQMNREEVIKRKIKKRVDRDTENHTEAMKETAMELEKELMNSKLDALIKNPEWISKNFMFNKKYPLSKIEKFEFYDFNYQLFKRCLQQNGFSLKKFIEELKAEIKRPSLCNNHHFFNNFIKNGGDKILDIKKSEIEEIYKKLRNNAIKENVLTNVNSLRENFFPTALHSVLYIALFIYIPIYVAIPLILVAMNTTINNKISVYPNKPVKKSPCLIERKTVEIQAKKPKDK